jgi:hypothetical protein
MDDFVEQNRQKRALSFAQKHCLLTPSELAAVVPSTLGKNRQRTELSLREEGSVSREDTFPSTASSLAVPQCIIGQHWVMCPFLM